MNDIFDEYGSVIIAVIAAILVIGGAVLLLNSGSFTQWIGQYVNSLGG